MNDARLRVLLVLLSRTYGGAEARVLTTAHTLGERATVATLNESALHSRLVADGLPYVTLTSGRGSLRTLIALRDTLRDGTYDVMDAHNVQSIWWGAWASALAGTPHRVATIHSDYAAEYPGLKGRLYAAALASVRPLMTGAIAVTPELTARTPNTTYVPNAVPIPAQPTETRAHTLAAEWGFTPGDFVVGVVGRLVPVKGHRYLLEALATLDDNPRIKLVVVGAGPLESDLRALTVRLNINDRVHFTGFREDVPAIMRNLDALCVPSLSEALPYVVLEAASEARPLVVTAVGGLRDLLTDGKTAHVVQPEDPAALANALRTLADDHAAARQLGRAAYDLVRARFSTAAMVEATLAAYNA